MGVCISTNLDEVQGSLMKKDQHINFNNIYSSILGESLETAKTFATKITKDDFKYINLLLFQ